MTMKTISTLIVISSLAACGGGPKTGLKSPAPPPPPPGPSSSSNNGPKEPARVATAEETSDYKSAYAAFVDNDKGAWSESQCRSVADKFSSVVRSHPKLVEAQYMVGLAYHRCN